MSEVGGLNKKLKNVFEKYGAKRFYVYGSTKLGLFLS